MGYTAEGTLEIDMVEFWGFVMKFYPINGDKILFGVPRFNQSNETMEIDFASSSEGSPQDWSVKPDVCNQWEEYNRKFKAGG